MRFSDLVPLLLNDRRLTDRQVENLGQMIGIGRVFGMKAGLTPPDISPVTDRTIVLESGHQPNFLPYPGVWKKVLLLDLAGRHIRARGGDAVCLFGFADYNLSTASYLSRNQVPAWNKQGSEHIGFKIPERDRWKCFHALEKPSEDRFQAEMERISTFYTENIRNLQGDRGAIQRRVDDITGVLRASYDRARTFPEMNAMAFARICTDIFQSKVLFFSYTDVQDKGLFRGISRKILTDFRRYNALFNASLAGNPGIPPVGEYDVPFWYHCECGGKVHLSTDPEQALVGTCPVCGRDHRIPTGAGNTGFDANYSRMSLNAVARNIIFSEGLGTALFVSGTGGGLRYGLLANRIAMQMGYHCPLTLSWRSKDYYLGIVHHRALRELMKTFQLLPADLADPALSGKIREFRSDLDLQSRTLQEAGGDKREVQGLRGRYLNSAVQAETVRRIFSMSPSLLDLLIACEPNRIHEYWEAAASGADVHREDQFLSLEADVIYPCDHGFPLAADSLPQVHRALETIEV